MRLTVLLSLAASAILADDRLVLTARGLASPVAAFDRDGNILVAGLPRDNFFTPCLAGEACPSEPRSLAGANVYVAGYPRTADRRLFEFTFAAADAWTLSALLPLPDGGLVVAVGSPTRHIVRRYDQRQQLGWVAEIPLERANLGFALRANGDLIYSGSLPQSNLAPLLLVLGRITPEGQVEPSPLNIGGTRISFGPDGSVLLAGQAIGGAAQAFPATPGALQPEGPFSFCGTGFLGFPCVHQFVAHVSADLRTLRMATFLTGSRGAGAEGPPMLLPDGSIAVVGSTTSSDYPSTAGAWIDQFPSRVPAGFRGAVQTSAGFVSVVSGDGRQLLYSTFVGGPGSATLTTVERAGEQRLRLSGFTSTGFAGLRGRTADCAPSDARLGAAGLSTSASFELEFDLALRQPGQSLVRPLLSTRPGALNQEQRLVWAHANESSALTLADVALREPAPAIHCAEEPALATPLADQLAPGQVVALFGAGWPINERLTYDSAATELPRELAGVRLLAESEPLPLVYVSPEQINFAVPSHWQPGQRKLLQLEVKGDRVAGREFTVIPPKPAVFQNIGNRCLFNTALAVDPASGALYDCPTPAPRNGVISVFVQGIGINAERQKDGQINRELDIPPPVEIASPRVELLSVTPAPGQAAGIWEVRVRLNAEQGGVERFPLRIGGELRDVTVSIR